MINFVKNQMKSLEILYQNDDLNEIKKFEYIKFIFNFFIQKFLLVFQIDVEMKFF